MIAAQGFPALSAAADGMAVSHPNGSFSYEMPVANGEKIICVGVNFPDRNAEYKDGTPAPANMSLFPRFARGFVGHGEALVRPPESHQLDYEGEIAIVIGKQDALKMGIMDAAVCWVCVFSYVLSSTELREDLPVCLCFCVCVLLRLTSCL